MRRMNELRINFEWIEPAGAVGEELRATWARFQISVDGKPITRPLDNVSKTVRDSVFLPLYPLAEWIATHWWFLLNEIETPGRLSEEDYVSRHDLHFGSEGFAMPNMLVRPLGDTVRIDWTPGTFPHQRIEFVGEGTAYISLSDFTNVLSNFITSVTSRLIDFNIYDTLLQQEWKTIFEAATEEKIFCEASAALGLDPYIVDDESAATIIKIGDALPSSLSAEFFYTADFPKLTEQFENVLHALNLSRSNPANLEQMKNLRETIQGLIKPSHAPWEQGYRVARQLRQQLNLDGKILRSFEDVSRALQVNYDELNRAIRTVDHSNGFDAVIDVNQSGSPGFVISSRRDAGLKFAFCRGLFEFLFTNPEEPSLVTKTRSERQKRNRAFASEFLLPAYTLRQRIQTQYVGEETIDDLAEEFGVSPFVVKHQLQNHGIAQTIPV